MGIGVEWGPGCSGQLGMRFPLWKSDLHCRLIRCAPKRLVGGALRRDCTESNRMCLVFFSLVRGCQVRGVRIGLQVMFAIATPFITAQDGVQNTNPFPLAFPPHNVSAKNPDTTFDWPSVIPIAADPYFYYRNSVPYAENYLLSYQRQITPSTLLTMSYTGNQGHHILAVISTNPSDQALCLSLSQPSEVAPGSPTCGPFGEDSLITSITGQVYQGTRAGLGPNYSEDTAQKTRNHGEITIRQGHPLAVERSLRGQSADRLSCTTGVRQSSKSSTQLSPCQDSQTARAASGASTQGSQHFGSQPTLTQVP
jgi:hypothetical protein